MAESEEELKKLLMRVKEESEKGGLKLNIQKAKIMASSLVISQQIVRGRGGSGDRLFCELQNHCGWWLQPWNKKMLFLWKESYDKPRQYIKKQRHHFAYKSLCNLSYGFSSSHIWMWELDHKEWWRLKNSCFWIVLLEKILSPLDKEFKWINPKGS